MAPSQQTALLLQSSFGKLVIDTTDVPKPGPGEILVKIQAAALNPVDWKVWKHNIHLEKYPAVLGVDIAGDVEEVGEGVTNVSVGDRILIQSTERYGGRGSGFQQYGVFQADLLAKIPANVSYEEASTMPGCLVTAFLGVFNKNPHGLGLPNPLVVGRNKSAGETILILGGAGSVGQFAIQCAKLAGLTVITTASPKHTNFLESLGATHVIDRNLSTDALIAQILEFLDGRPLKYSLDAVGSAETEQIAYDLLAPNGGILLVGPDTIRNKVKGKNINQVYGWAHRPENYETAASLFKGLPTLLEEGTIKPNRVEVVPNGLAGIPGGLERLGNNQVSGVKLVVRPQETPSDLCS